MKKISEIVKKSRRPEYKTVIEARDKIIGHSLQDQWQVDEGSVANCKEHSRTIILEKILECPKLHDYFY